MMFTALVILFTYLVHKTTGGWMPETERFFGVAMFMDFIILILSIVIFSRYVPH